MDTLLAFWDVYGDQVVRLVLELVALVALTRWGQANRQALQATTEAIERMVADKPILARELKRSLALNHDGLPDDAAAALQSAVASAEDTVLGLTTKPKTGATREILGVAIRLLPLVLRILSRRALVLLCCLGLAAGLYGCVTTVAPDGTRVTTVDYAAVEALAPLLEDALDRLDEYQARRDEARAAGDEAEAKRYERLIQTWQEIRDGRAKALEAAGAEAP